jgi:hypothetical protein
MGFLTASARSFHRLLHVVRTRTFELVRMTLRWVPGTRAVVQRVRRAVLTRDLRRLHDVLAATAFDGRYAVCGGMLLGWAREGRLLLDDAGDADFVFDAVDAPAFAAVVPMLARAGFAPTTRFCNNNGDPAEYRFERHGARFDFFAAWNVGARTRYYMYADGDELVCERFRQRNAPFEFLGRRWLKPEDHERALADNYGDWRTPSSEWHYTKVRTLIARHPARFGPEAWDGTELPETECP